MIVVVERSGRLAAQDVVHRTAVAAPFVETVKPISDRRVGHPLQIGVQRRTHLQAGFVQLLGAVSLFEVLSDFLDEIGRHRALAASVHDGDRLGARRLGLIGRDVAVGFHPAQDVAAPGRRTLETDERTLAGRRLDDAGEQRGFRELQLVR